MLLLIDKPKGFTSHDVVNIVRRITGERRVGHGGTLDPNATGLLIIGVGRESTRKLGKISKNTRKSYVAEIILGEERDTDDAEGIKLIVNSSKLKNKSKISKTKILNVLKSFLGEQNQTPPVYSAIKIKGKKAYELARKGKILNLKPRKVTIHSIKLLDYQYPTLKIECEVSSGTYIRAIARDMGRILGTGGYLKNLRRTKIGKYEIKNAVSISILTEENWKKFGQEDK